MFQLGASWIAPSPFCHESVPNLNFIARGPVIVLITPLQHFFVRSSLKHSINFIRIWNPDKSAASCIEIGTVGGTSIIFRRKTSSRLQTNLVEHSSKEHNSVDGFVVAAESRYFHICYGLVMLGAVHLVTAQFRLTPTECSGSSLPNATSLRRAGATRAQARGVTDSRIGSDGWFKGVCRLSRHTTFWVAHDLLGWAYSFVMSPHPNDLHRPFLWVDLIHESVLDIGPARPRAIEIPDQPLICWRALKRILLQNLKQAFCLEAQITGRQVLGVLLGLLGIIERPGHQVSSVLDLLNGSRNPFRIDSRIPGIDKR